MDLQRKAQTGEKEIESWQGKERKERTCEEAERKLRQCAILETFGGRKANMDNDIYMLDFALSVRHFTRKL